MIDNRMRDCHGPRLDLTGVSQRASSHAQWRPGLSEGLEELYMYISSTIITLAWTRTEIDEGVAMSITERK